jgi:hypothetical protein
VGVGDGGSAAGEALAVHVEGAPRDVRVTREVEEIPLALLEQVGRGWRPLDDRIPPARASERDVGVSEDDVDGNRSPAFPFARLRLIDERHDRRVAVRELLLGARGRRD